MLIFLNGTYFAPLFMHIHVPPTAVHFPVASPSYSELSFDVGTKTRASRYKCKKKKIF